MFMKKHLIILLPFVAALCACTGCQKDGGEGEAEPTWGKASLSIRNPIAPGDTLCYQIEFKLDTLSGDGLLARQLAAVIRDSIICVEGYATVQEAMTACADSIEKEWKTEMAEMYDPESDMRELLQYNYIVEGSPVENSPEGILSYQASTDWYMGGAHGIYVVTYFNFDKATGKLLDISDIVPADKEEAVLEAMKEQLCKDWDAKDWTDLQEETGIGALGELYLTNNFLLKNDSIEFLFNQYEIAPYAAGLIGVTVKWP